MGIGQAGDRARLRRRLHPAGVAEAGVAYHDPIIEGAPGHGEGHNSGMPLQIAAALAVKKVMEQQHLQGTLMLWPGIAEELVGTKAYYVRAGMFKDVDISIFAHVVRQPRRQLGRRQSERPGLGRVQVHGRERAHAAARRGAASRRSTRWS
jgi:aminobenzoyl-glutamate utilization protein B